VRLHPVQAEFRRSDALYRAFCGGIGSGKSWVGAYDLIRRAKRGRTYMVVGPSYTSLESSSMKSFLKAARDLGVLDPAAMRLSAPPQLTLSTGAEILFRSADRPEGLRGPNLSGVWLDEASLMPRLAYDVSIGRLREDGEQGWLSATFTPKGSQHWTFEAFNTGLPNTVMFRAKTRDNPFNPAGFADKILQQYGDTNFARQELEGEFVQLEGAEFPAEWLCGDDLWFDAWPEKMELKVIALDPSKGSDGKGKDYQAHVLIGAAVEDSRWVYYVDAVAEREGVTQMCLRSVELCREFGATGRLVDSVVVEENGTLGFIPQAFDAACVKAGYPIPYICRTNTDRKESRIRQQVAPPLSRRQIKFRRTPGGRKLVGQCQSFPHDEYDDVIDALATGLARVAELLI
jgi:phage terminase large subunit-like protein